MLVTPKQVKPQVLLWCWRIHLCPFTKKKNSSGNLLSCFWNFLFNLSDFWGFTQHCAHEIALCSRERWWFSSIKCPSKPWPMQNLPKVECSPHQLAKRATANLLAFLFTELLLKLLTITDYFLTHHNFMMIYFWTSVTSPDSNHGSFSLYFLPDWCLPL